VRYPVLYYRLGLHRLVSRQVLLLTTTGRKTGLQRLVPVDYEEEGGTYYIVPNQGTHATWYRNLVAHPEVTIQVGRRRVEAIATPVTDLELKAHVLRRFAGARWSFRVKKYYGIPPGATDEQLLELAPHRAVVAVRPRTS
jgi:deazaflavin-dependent oxidoreductase (nitroreductase family)